MQLSFTPVVIFILSVLLILILNNNQVPYVQSSTCTEDHPYYLANCEGPTTTTRPSLTRTPSPTTTFISNTSFEQRAGFWNPKSRHNIAVIQKIPVMARTGKWLAIFGGYANETASITQITRVPKTARVLSFYYKIRSNEPCGRFADIVFITINNNIVWKLDACSYQVSPKWTHATLNIRRFVNSKISLSWQMQTNHTNHSTWFIDDIGWR